MARGHDLVSLHIALVGRNHDIGRSPQYVIDHVIGCVVHLLAAKHAEQAVKLLVLGVKLGRRLHFQQDRLGAVLLQILQLARHDKKGLACGKGVLLLQMEDIDTLHAVHGVGGQAWVVL